MKRCLIVLILFAMISCSKHERAAETFPNVQQVEDELITYEGILPSESGLKVDVELTLLPASPGLDSYYWLNESLNEMDAQKFILSSRSQGKYAILNAPDGGYLIQILNRRRMLAIIRGKQFSPGDNVNYVTENLFLRSNGDQELILVDDDFNEVIPRYTLTRRSELFTVEGYLTVVGDSTAEYFERNTRKTWRLARLGYYDEAISQYHALAKEKFEGIYVRALAYTVRVPDAEGKETDQLVLKRILVIEATQPLQ